MERVGWVPCCFAGRYIDEGHYKAELMQAAVVNFCFARRWAIAEFC